MPPGGSFKQLIKRQTANREQGGSCTEFTYLALAPSVGVVGTTRSTTETTSIPSAQPARAGDDRTNQAGLIFANGIHGPAAPAHLAFVLARFISWAVGTGHSMAGRRHDFRFANVD